VFLGAILWGVLHGLGVFLPIMLIQGTEGHVVNAASVAGLITYHASAPCHLTKHAIVALSEKLYYDLALCGAHVQVSVLCPGWVKTRIMDSGRIRPSVLQDDPSTAAVSPERRQ